jgi:hypothetical protein
LQWKKMPHPASPAGAKHTPRGKFWFDLHRLCGIGKKKAWPWIVTLGIAAYKGLALLTVPQETVHCSG